MSLGSVGSLVPPASRRWRGPPSRNTLNQNLIVPSRRQLQHQTRESSSGLVRPDADTDARTAALAIFAYADSAHDIDNNNTVP